MRLTGLRPSLRLRQRSDSSKNRLNDADRRDWQVEDHDVAVVVKDSTGRWAAEFVDLADAHLVVRVLRGMR